MSEISVEQRQAVLVKKVLRKGQKLVRKSKNTSKKEAHKESRHVGGSRRTAQANEAKSVRGKKI